MSDVPPSMHTSPISDNSDSGPRARNDKRSCWPCRFRKKGCKPGPWGPQGPCRDCYRFNIVCCGQGIERPPGQALANQVRADCKIWIGNHANRVPTTEPLALSYILRPPPSSPVAPNSPVDYQDPNCTPVATASPFFGTNETSSSHFQAPHTADHASSYNHAAPIYPSETGAWWNDAQFDVLSHTQCLPPSNFLWSEDLLSFPPAAFLPTSSNNGNVVPPSSGFFNLNILGNIEGYPYDLYLTPEQLTFYHDLENGMDLAWGSPPA